MMRRKELERRRLLRKLGLKKMTRWLKETRL